MKKAIIFPLILVLLLCGCARPPQEQKKPFTTGVFFSYIDLAAMIGGEQEYRAAVKEAVFNIKTYLGADAVFFHARSHLDAAYCSDIFKPNARIPKNTDGAPLYDPLKIFIELAQEEGIGVYAWLNPFRIGTDRAEYVDYVERRGYSVRGSVATVGGSGYLDPSSAAARSLICAGARELLEGYDIAGIVIDDYFYPTTAKSFDAAAYAAYKTAGVLSLGDWRRENIYKLIAELKELCFEYGAEFGISPDASIERNYTTHHADIEAFCRDGLVDFVCPQIYFGFENATMPFEAVLTQWSALVSGTNIRLYPALAAYKIGVYDKYAGAGAYEWCEDIGIIPRQVDISLQFSSGVVYYRYESLFAPDSAVAAFADSVLESLKDR